MLDPLNKEHVPSDLAIEESGVDLDGVMVFRDDNLVDALEPTSTDGTVHDSSLARLRVRQSFCRV